MQLRDQLLNASPYLSDTVMVNAAEKEAVLPNSIVTEILAENPQSAKAENVLNKLNERTTPPNENEMAQIHANDTVLGHKESLESKVAFYRSEKVRNTSDLVRLYQKDTTVTNKLDSIESALANVNTPGSYYLQAFCRYGKHDSSGIITILNNVTSDFNLTSSEQNLHTYFNTYFDILLDLQSQNKSFAEIDTTQRTALNNMAANANGYVQTLARNLLLYNKTTVYHEPYILPDTTQTKSASVKSGNSNFNLWQSNNYFTLYPNPANQYITLEYTVDYNISKPVIEIVTLSGTRINSFRLTKHNGVKIIDLRDYRSGIYLVRLSNNGRTLQTERFVKY